MLQEGKSTQLVAEHFGVSRQAIDLHRREFIRRGLLTDERAARRRRTPAAADSLSASPVAAETPPRVPPEDSPHVPRTASLDDLIELVITAVSALRRLPELEAELTAARRDYRRAVEELERLRAEAHRRQDQELRWRLAQHDEHDTPSSHQ